MDQDNSITVPSDITSLGGKSWTAFVGTAILALVLLAIAVFAGIGAPIAGLVLFVPFFAFIAYRVMVIKSYHLYYNDIGVWVFSGVLPWSKGVSGVKWRDLDEAVFYQSLFSWMFKSYSIRIGHRFTKSNEIFLSHWAQGQNAVTRINSHHQELVRNNRLG